MAGRMLLAGFGSTVMLFVMTVSVPLTLSLSETTACSLAAHPRRKGTVPTASASASAAQPRRTSCFCFGLKCRSGFSF